ncbi:MAG: sulfotransferase domain-containing protein [Anaerolineaceae bacterium]|nr:sulfotransferase domain-containing protein [Anaerolineaceae bacterium]
MKKTPAVSCICPTYGRSCRLEEAIYSFIQQDYSGPKELIVLNHHPQHLLEFGQPEVKIYNHPTSFQSTGEIWNAAVALATNDLIFVWDVADVHLPHRLSHSVAKFDQTIGFYKLDATFLWSDGRLSGIENSAFHHSSCWSRERFDQTNGYDPQLVYGSEEEFEHRLRQSSQRLNGRKNLDPQYIYCIKRWQENPGDRPLFLNRNHKGPKKNQQRIQLNPHWKFNYPQLVQNYLASAATPNRFQNPDKRTQNIRVDFMIAGAQKSGTSALDAYLRLNPEICMAGRKEIHFFDNERIFNQKTGDYSSPARFFPWFGLEGFHLPEPESFAGNKYDLYHAFFSPQPPQRLCGEATPEYMYWYDAPRRMWHYNPAMKIIILLRNPIERAYSHWNMRRKRPPNKRERRSFRKALEMELQKPPHTRPLQFKERYIDRGFYTEQIRRIWHYFPKSQTLFLKTEALKIDPQTSVDTVCDFLGVERMTDLPPKTVFVTPYANPLSRADHALLKDVYQAEIKKLEQLLEWDCQDWLRDPAPTVVDK